MACKNCGAVPTHFALPACSCGMKPKPAGLTPEMLGEEDREIGLLLVSQLETLKELYKAARRGSVHVGGKSLSANYSMLIIDVCHTQRWVEDRLLNEPATTDTN